MRHGGIKMHRFIRAFLILGMMGYAPLVICNWVYPNLLGVCIGFLISLACLFIAKKIIWKIDFDEPFF